jgi:sugar phosphate isomerase/epimerase
MKFAFYTSVFGELSLEEIARWANDAGFDGVEIDFGRHIREPENTASSVGAAREAGLEVCAITLFGNLLDRDADARERIRDRVTQVLADATRINVPALVVFPGRNESISEERNYEGIAGFFEGLLANQSSGTKVVIENWPGMNKNYVATTPSGWRRLFSLVKSPNLGLEFDPSHLLWQGIDPLPVVLEFASRIHLVHAKDTRLERDRIQDVGYCGNWWEYRLPGRGELDWRKFLGFLSRENRFSGFASIEHEDRDFGWPDGSIEARKEGLLNALAVLRESIEYVEGKEESIGFGSATKTRRTN